MSTKHVNPCKSCGLPQASIVKCDHCGAEAPSMPIEVRSTIDGDTDYTHYCSLPCLLAVRIEAEGVAAGWEQLDIRLDGGTAVNAIKAMGRKEGR